MRWDEWLLWSSAFVSLGGPVAALVLDRAVGISGRLIWTVVGLPGLAALAGVCTYAAVAELPLCSLIYWGVVGGAAGTIALDIVRLIGVRFGAFPTDMPQVFGAIGLGIAPRLQAHIMTELVDEISRLPDAARERALVVRLDALGSMSAARRRTAMTAMMHALGHLPAERRQAMLRTQMEILSGYPSERRRALMTTMDQVRAAAGDGRNRGAPRFAPPPRGLPKLPMATFRAFAERAFPRTLQETGTSRSLLLAVGYGWHLIIGITFGVAYTLLFGAGVWGSSHWALAFLWGIFIWAMMMILMPPMMPLVRLPRWFPGVPLIAHLALAAPIGFFAHEYVDAAAHGVSIVGVA